MILRNLRENTTSKTSCAAVYQQQLTGTRVAVKESQERCLNELRVELKKLGVREGVWQTARVVVH